MNDRGATASIRFYFSFRSPYAWLAAERLEPELGGLGVPIERIPVYPTPTLRLPASRRVFAVVQS